MDSIYEDISRILENRRIRSEILSGIKNEKLKEEHPQIAAMEKEIASLQKERMLLSLQGMRSLDLERSIARKSDEMEKLLASLNVKPEDMEVQPYCKLCGDTGYVTTVGKDGSETTKTCTCIRQLLAPVMLSRSGVEQYPSYSFEKGKAEFYKDDPRLKEAYGKFSRLAEKGTLPNMVFYGSSGKGKTFLAVAIAREYAKQGRSSLVLRLPDFQELSMEHRKVLQSFYMDSRKERDIEDRFSYMMDADLLVLDDLGVEARTANAEADLLSLLDKRMLAGKTTIITTNYGKKALNERYGGRFFDRIVRGFKTVPFSKEEKAQ